MNKGEEEYEIILIALITRSPEYPAEDLIQVTPETEREKMILVASDETVVGEISTQEKSWVVVRRKPYFRFIESSLWQQFIQIGDTP
ncbi:MAG: hypothetical protein P1V20_17250 [Verrucomicrobiales bacterium]|nr:hypothetical protein [Verrucomicrobiales bacterium]